MTLAPKQSIHSALIKRNRAIFSVDQEALKKMLRQL